MTHRQILVVFSGLMLGMLLAALDQSIVSTALPTIVGDFHSLNRLTWVVTAYLLTSTVSAPLYGKISDLYGRKRIFQFAIVIFLAGSVLAGLSRNMDQLIALPRSAGTRRRRADRARDGHRGRRRARLPNVAATRATSARCSVSRASRARLSEASSSTTPPGAGSST